MWEEMKKDMKGLEKFSMMQEIDECQSMRCIDESIGISSNTLTFVYQTKWCHAPYTCNECDHIEFVYYYTLNEGIAMCLEINQFTQNERQHSLFILE